MCIVSCFKRAKLHTCCITYVKVCTYIIRMCTCNLPSKLGMQCICYNHVVIRHAISSTYYLLGYYGDLIHLSHSRFSCRSGWTVSQQGSRLLPLCPRPLARPHAELLWQFHLFWVRIQNLAAAIWKDRWKLICVCCSKNPEVPLQLGIKHFHSPVKVSPPNSPRG